MKILHVLGHNSNWNLDAFSENSIGDGFIISAFSHGADFIKKRAINEIIEESFIDLQFYGKKRGARMSKGKLKEFEFHPVNHSGSDATNQYIFDCIIQAIKYQINIGFKKIIIPHFYENDDLKQIISTFITINNWLKNKRIEGVEYYMTLPFANHIIIDREKVERILIRATDMDIVFDGFYIVTENKPEYRKKITIDWKIIENLSTVLKTLKLQKYITILGYANWDSILYLAQTNIDYITTGTYENLRNFSINRFIEDESGGASKGYYFSEKLLNMIRADDLTVLRRTHSLDLIKNSKNIFSDIILQEGFPWNIHKPEVNKNYLLSISRLLESIDSIDDISQRKSYVIDLIEKSELIYKELERRRIYLQQEGENYHLSTWKTYLLRS
jgi:hypothetical protein